MLRVEKNHRWIKERHLKKALLPREVVGRQGRVVVTRPPEYDPPFTCI